MTSTVQNDDLRNAASEFLVRYGGDRFDNLFRSAQGTIVVDDEGREILDFTSGQMCATLGHNHPAIVAQLLSDERIDCTLKGGFQGHGRTALKVALKKGHDECVKALREHGAPEE